MAKNTRTGSHLFFIEFLIVLFFFLIISTICLKLFVRANLITKEANALSQSQSYASSIAEIIEGSDGSLEALLALFPDAVIHYDANSADSAHTSDLTDSTDSAHTSDLTDSDSAESAHTSDSTNSESAHSSNSGDRRSSGTLTLYFDRDFHTCPADQTFYTLTARVSVDNHWKNGEICVQKPDGTQFYCLPVSFYSPTTAKEVLP